MLRLAFVVLATAVTAHDGVFVDPAHARTGSFAGMRYMAEVSHM